MDSTGGGNSDLISTVHSDASWLHRAGGTGLLADLDSNGVNQYLIDMESSIERVDLDTIKNEFIDVFYAPSYSLDDREAQSFDWYEQATQMSAQLKSLIKIQAVISKHVRRLNVVSERV